MFFKPTNSRYNNIKNLIRWNIVKVREMLKRIILAAVLLVLMVILLGCNTVEGMGKDIEWVGQKGEEVLQGK